MRYPFDSEEAQELNKKVFETIYYFALKVNQQALRAVATCYNVYVVDVVRAC